MFGKFKFKGNRTHLRTEDALMKKLMEDKKKREQTGLGIPYKNEEWINSLKEDKARVNIILENIDRLKLPKKLVHHKDLVK